MAHHASLVWFRSDLRVSDNPALVAAAARGGAVIPFFCLDPGDASPWAPGGATRWWLHHSLQSLAASLEARGSRLVVRRGTPLAVIRALLRETGADAVYWNRRYEPDAIAADRHCKETLRRDGVQVHSSNASLLLEPWENGKEDGTPYRVFTPFWKAMLKRGGMPAPVPVPTDLPGPAEWPACDGIEALGLLPRIDWAAGMRKAWKPGEAGAQDELLRFLHEGIARYAARRDHPGEVGTSRLSPHLHFGEIGPRAIWRTVQELAATRGEPAFDKAAESWLRQLAWREFGHHLLFHFPHTTDQPLQERFARFPWKEDPAGLLAWQRGRTGYPIVDAGMRELWSTGWMHNRVRMVVASFLVKDLRVAWQEGARWFWDTLVDANLANNTLGWQWTAGCGADAAPYFRVFNPRLQSLKFDPEGTYLKRWLPELAKLDAKWIHEPASAPAEVLEAAGVRLGETYPYPIVAHDEAKRLALDALASLDDAQA